MSSKSSEKQLCEWAHCDTEAAGWVEAQWSIADFVRYEFCANHLRGCDVYFRGRTVDNQKPIYVHWQFYAPVE